MKLEQLESEKPETKPPVLEGEVLPGLEEFEDDETEVDLQQALVYIERLLLTMEDIIVHRGRIIRIPEGMHEVMEEVNEWLSQWNNNE